MPVEPQQTGSYSVKRTARIEVFRVSDIADAEKSVNEWLTQFTEPGWQFEFAWTTGAIAPMLCALAVLDELVQDGAQ